MTRERYIERIARAMYGELWKEAEAQEVAIGMAYKAATVYSFDDDEEEQS